MNREELAKSLGMSKATLYKRSKELGISKESLDNLTDVQKSKLMHTKLNYNKTSSTNSKNISKVEDNRTHLPDEDTTQSLEILKKQNSNLREQLKIKDKQLSASQDNITHAHNLTEEAHKLADQAQQLQLDLQQKLNQIDQEKIELLNQNKQLSASFNNSNNSQLKNDLIELQTQLTQEKSLTASLKVENDELQKQNDELEADTAIHIQNLNNELNDLKNQAIANHDAMRKKEADYSSLAREKQELENKLIIITNEKQNKTFFEKLFRK